MPVPQTSPVQAYTTDEWSAYYPGKQVVVVTKLGRPPLPPSGYIPRRLGMADNPLGAASKDEQADACMGFSLDTFLWDEAMLEERLQDVMSWTRRPMPTQREKLARVNWLINSSSRSSSSTAS